MGETKISEKVDKLSKAKSSKNRTIKIVLLAVVVAVSSLIIPLCMYLFRDDIPPKDSPINPLPAYPAATAITATNVSRIEQEIKTVGAGDINYEIISGLHYQIYITTDTTESISNFYENAAEKAGLTTVASGDGNNYNEVFAHDKAFSSAKQYISGFAVLFDISYLPIISQWVREPALNTKIIVTFQGLAYVYYG